MLRAQSHLDAPIPALLYTVFTAILEVFLLCLAGYILAAKGILDKKTQKQLNRLNVSLFTPALLFSKVAFFLTPAKLKELWIIPLFFVVVTIVSMTVAFILGSVFRLKKSQRSFAMAASMFMNSNSLPIALMQSLVVTVHGLKWTKDDNKNAMLGRALTYLVLYSTLGMVLRWSFGVKLLAQADDEDVPSISVEAPGEQTPFLNTVHQQYGAHVVDVRKPVPSPPKRFYRSFPNSPNASRLNLAADCDVPETSVSTLFSPSRSSTPTYPEDFDSDDSGPVDCMPTNDDLPIHKADESEPSRLSIWMSGVKAALTRFWKGFNDFMTVPLWAALLSLIVALAQPLQHALKEHMQPVKGALESAGNCSIPVTLIVLGAYFYATPQRENNTKPLSRHKKHPKTFFATVKGLFQRKTTTPQATIPGETATVIIAVASRMFITPMLLLPFLALSTRLSLQEVFDDPVFIVAFVLLIASPPALTLAQITQAASGEAFERLISRTIFWAYCVVTPPATIAYVMIGLLVSKL